MTDPQDHSNPNKLLEQRLIDLQTELNAARVQLDQEQENAKQREAAIRRSVQQDVALEENQRWQAEFATLKQTLEIWKRAEEEKEAELKRLKGLLGRKDDEIAELQQAKITIQGKATQEMSDALAQFRTELRQAVQAIIAEKDQQMAELKAEMAAECARLNAQIQAKQAEIEARDESIARRFQERHQELADFWAKREQEMWDRAQDAQRALEANLKERWVGRERELASEYDRKAALLKAEIAQQKAELQIQAQELEKPT